MENLEKKLITDQECSQILENQPKPGCLERVKWYLKGCFDPDNARLYGTFQERAALNTTQFHKIQGSLLIRMGIVYPLVSYAVEQAGLPKDCSTEIGGMAVNYHTWVAGYGAYLIEIQSGLSKYPMEGITKGINAVKEYFTKPKVE